MKVVIAGMGRGGLSVAVHLAKLGHEVTVIDRDEALVKRAYEQHGLVSLAGDATDALFLHEADVGRADVVVGMLHRDADNLAFALLAKQSGAKRVMVRMRDDAYRPLYMAAGVNRMLSEGDVFVGAFSTTIEHEAIRHSMLLGKGESIAFELEIPEDSAAAGKTVLEIDADPRFPTSCVFAGLYEPNGAVLAPRGSSIVTGGMIVLLVARRDELASVLEFFMSRRPR